MADVSLNPQIECPTKPSELLLRVDDLHVEFHTRQGPVRAVNGLSYDLHRGETLAILGESGSGKSVSAMAILGILPTPPARVSAGRVQFKGKDLLRLPSHARQQIKGAEISMIFQDALTALNPVFTVGSQIAEMFTAHRGTSRAVGRRHAAELMDRVQIPSAKKRLNDYPHQFSGGMRQRIMIAMAIALDPDIIIADEPTTALDVTVQAQIMELLAELQQDNNSALVLITHDLGVVAEVADRVCVMYGGRAVEQASVHDLFERPLHPYTESLMRSIPNARSNAGRLTVIPGSPPDPRALPNGCTFHPRCPRRRDVCAVQEPPDIDVGDRSTRCMFYEDLL